jgi:hypothetical protein
VEAPEAGAVLEEAGQMVYEDHAAPPTCRGPPEQDLLVFTPLYAHLIINLKTYSVRKITLRKGRKGEEEAFFPAQLQLNVNFVS